MYYITPFMSRNFRNYSLKPKWKKLILPINFFNLLELCRKKITSHLFKFFINIYIGCKQTRIEPVSYRI